MKFVLKEEDEILASDWVYQFEDPEMSNSCTVTLYADYEGVDAEFCIGFTVEEIGTEPWFCSIATDGADLSELIEPEEGFDEVMGPGTLDFFSLELQSVLDIFEQTFGITIDQETIDKLIEGAGQKIASVGK